MVDAYLSHTVELLMAAGPGNFLRPFGALALALTLALIDGEQCMSRGFLLNTSFLDDGNGVPATEGTRWHSLLTKCSD